jgi:hypothetical protein
VGAALSAEAGLLGRPKASSPSAPANARTAPAWRIVSIARSSVAAFAADPAEQLEHTRRDRDANGAEHDERRQCDSRRRAEA